MGHPSTQTFYNHIIIVCPSQTRRMVDLVKLTGLTRTSFYIETEYRQSTDTSAPTFSSFNNLHTIDLSYNRLSGHLPHTWPPTLQVLNLSSNHFDGTIQTTNLQSFQSMITLNISNNSFTGTIPPSICSNSPALVNLDFSLNHFTRNIPQGFGACSNLVVLSLGSY
ncbi:putative leucine-rich repeat domain superfamily [Helianthus debilis subsp. tardiflorus]